MDEVLLDVRGVVVTKGESTKAIDKLPLVQNVCAPRPANVNSFKKEHFS
jgi:hypothetical protein